MLAFLLSAATATGASPAEPAVIIDFTVPPPCAEAEAPMPDQIVVCAPADRKARYRLSGAGPQRRSALPKAEVQLADGMSLAAETESADLGMARAQRAMVRLKIKF